MGYMSANTIVVTSWDGDLIQKAHEKATEIFCQPFSTYAVMQISTIVKGAANGYISFFIPPDGSKEGWDCSNEYDNRRARFKEWLVLQAFEDGSTSLHWVEVQFADDNDETKIVDHSEANR
jgi:hypothetical protein